MSEYYMRRLYAFLRELNANNNREWFNAHKPLYEELRALWLADLDRLIALMSSFDPTLAGRTGKECAYRIYRDTRFKQDKTPYKTYFSASISRYGRKAHSAGFYLQVGPGSFEDSGIESGLYGGIWCPDTPTLTKLRHAMVDNIEEFEQILADPGLQKVFPGWCGATLKTAPKGWNRNHPQAHLLRLKDIGKFHPCNEKFFSTPDWVERSADMFHTLFPFVEFLRYSVEEE